MELSHVDRRYLKLVMLVDRVERVVRVYSVEPDGKQKHFYAPRSEC